MHARRTGTFADAVEIHDAVAKGLREAMDQVLKDRELKDRDWLWFHFGSGNSEKNYYGAHLRVEEWREDPYGRATAAINHVVSGLQSSEFFEENEQFELAIVWVDANDRGRGMKPGQVMIEDLIKKKETVVAINNQDDLCCARALVTGIARHEGKKPYDRVRRGQKLQKNKAVLLHRNAGVPPGACGIPELKKFQDYLKDDYRIIVCYAGRGFNAEPFAPPGKPEIYLLHINDHYHLITTLAGFLTSSYVCKYCLRGYDHEGKHKCRENPGYCTSCRQQDCDDHLHPKEDATIHCEECNLWFKGPTCFRNHKTFTIAGQKRKENSVCETVQACKQCGKHLKNKKEIQHHRCGFVKCPSCKEYVDYQTHKCYIQTAAQEEGRKLRRKRKRYEDDADDDCDEGCEEGEEEECEGDYSPPIKKKKKLPTVHEFFDIEARIDHGQHTAVLLVSWNDQEDEPRKFHGEDCVKQYLNHLDKLATAGECNVTAIAHNFKAYDGLFVVREYYKNNVIVEQLRQGLKLLQVKHGNIRFIDSMSFIAGSLRSFANTFGVEPKNDEEEEIRKGFFPHLLHTKEHENYVGKLPCRDYFGPQSMSQKERAEFDDWYDKELVKYREDPSKVYDLQVEMEKYCIADVKLLKTGCEIFKDESIAVTGLNPFDSVTIATACMKDLKKNHLPENTIASEPIMGWRGGIKSQSTEAKQWLLWEERKLGRQIRSALNEGEFHIRGTRYHVDGYDAKTMTCYEYQGCFWHGCEHCYPNRTEKHQRLGDRHMDSVRKETTRKVEQLRRRGYKVIEMWGCQWKKEKESNEECRNFTNQLEFTTPLNPRDGFFGGRTNAYTLYYKCKPGEKIKYDDFTSLYPFVNKTKRYPIKHPQIIVEPGTTDINAYFGMVKCKVLPPRQLYHPVLPYKEDGKLLFPLCRSCIDAEMKKSVTQRKCTCGHTDEERCITGTWCTPELEKAVEKGYQIQHIYEVWHFPESKEGLFASYVNCWLKIKQENTELPTWIESDEDKEYFVELYEENEGIVLNISNLQGENKGKRSIAKIQLNSMWGKFGQNSNKTKTMVCTSIVELHDMLESDKYEFYPPRLVGDEMVELEYYLKDEDAEINADINIFVAAFTTCWGRLELYNLLDLKGEDALYCDTDGMMHVWRPGCQDVKRGDYLGQPVSELKGDDYITEYVSAGPKNYG